MTPKRFELQHSIKIKNLLLIRYDKIALEIAV